MSCVIVVSPIIIAGWPLITAAVTGAVGAMGFNAVTAGVEASVNRVELEIDHSEVLHAADDLQNIVVARPGVVAVFSRDSQGMLKLCMEGDQLSKSDLKRLGQELIDRVTQQYVYHRLMTELKQRNMIVIDEEISADRTVKIRVRNP